MLRIFYCSYVIILLYSRPIILAFLFIGIVDVSGVVFGMSSLAKITEENENVPGSIFAFIGCGVGTLCGAMTGT